MPTQVLMQYKQNPSKQAVDGMPMDMLAGLELSRRAELQQQQMARMAPNPQQMPTVVDQAAMGLAGMAPQAQVPQMPGAPMQFQAAPQVAPQAAPQAPQAAPQAAPQQMAQAPRPPAPPAQPTQQQPQKLATGGIASLGDMQDARDQGGMPGYFPAGQPVQMMARGGIVAFQNNYDQPVDPNMPSTIPREDGEEEPRTSTAGNVLRDIGAWFKRQQEASRETQRRNREANQTRRDIAEARPGLFEQLTPTERDQRNQMADTLQRYSDMGKPGAAPAATPAPADGPIKPSDLTVTQGGGGGLDINKLIAQFNKGSGGGGGFDPAKMQALIDRYMKPTESETAYQKLVQEQMDAIRNRQSPEVSEADRQRIIDEQFAKNQAMSKPYYERMQKLIDEERTSNKERYADAASNARLRLGLGLLGSKAPGFGQALSEAATPALDYYDKAQELQAAANAKTRQAEMDLMKARMSDEKGDREAAQRYFDSYQKNRREAEAYEIQRANMLITAQKGLVDTEGKRERAGMALQLGLDRAAAQAENAGLRNQLGLMGLAARLQGQGQRPMTLNEKLALEKRVGEVFGNPASPEFQRYVGSMPNGQQLLADLKNGRIKPDNPQFRGIVEQAKRRYTQDLLGGTRSSSGVTSYDQAASDLLGQ